MAATTTGRILIAATVALAVSLPLDAVREGSPPEFSLVPDPQGATWVADPVASANLPAAAALEISPPSAPPASPARTTEAGALASLREQFDALLGNGAPGSGRWSVLAVSLDRGDTLFARAPDQALAPASNMKLLTAAAALAHLGPEHRFTTYLLSDGRVTDGVLEGDLILYGTGDPTLGRRFAGAPAPELMALADSVVALGVHTIEGDLIGDGSYFSGAGSGEGWRTDYVNAWYAAPAGALSVHENLVGIEVSAGEPGGPPLLRFVPGGAGIAVRNEAVTGGAGRPQVLRLDYAGPVVVRGGVGAGTSLHSVPVRDAATYAAALLRDVLAERGVTLRGRVRSTDDGVTASPLGTVFGPASTGAAPGPRVLATHRSPPLREILRVIQHQSHNFYSEQVFRTVGRVWGGVGSAEMAGRALEALLADAGVDTTGVQILDGCGLSPQNLMTAGAFVALLAHAAEAPWGDAFLDLLPVAGETARFRRMGGTPAQGNLRAKTGTIDRVSALSGYVTTARGERIAFSIIANDLAAVSRGKHVENVIGATLASLDRAGPGAGSDQGEAAAPPPEPAPAGTGEAGAKAPG